MSDDKLFCFEQLKGHYYSPGDVSAETCRPAVLPGAMGGIYLRIIADSPSGLIINLQDTGGVQRMPADPDPTARHIGLPPAGEGEKGLGDR